VQPHRHHPRDGVSSETVQAVLHDREKVLGCREARADPESNIIHVAAVREHQVRFLSDSDEVRKVVVECVAVIEESGFDEQTSRMGCEAVPEKPAVGSNTGGLLK
jgi:hypothetical protein